MSVDQAHLLEAATKICFIEATMANPTPLNDRLKQDVESVATD